MLLAWKTTFFPFRVNHDVVHAEFEVLELREHFGEGVAKPFVDMISFLSVRSAKSCFWLSCCDLVAEGI